MVVEIVSVGTELLLGNIVNTNASYLAEQCANLGLNSYYQSVVGDNEERLESTLLFALSRADIVILSGGLGPTMDDITKEVSAKVMEMPLLDDEYTRERIKEHFKNRWGKIPDSNWKQALVPEGARVIDNKNGTAPGLVLEKNNKIIILLPGPPNEMIPMFEEKIAPFLSKLVPEVIYSKVAKITGIGESRVVEIIDDLLSSQTNPTIAPYAKIAEVHLRITAKARNKEEVIKLIEPITSELKERFGENLYTFNEKETLEENIVNHLQKKKLTITTAESCSGGLLAGRIVNVSGASNVFKEGIITYSNEAKIKHLNVKEETLRNFGAVSEETAKEMAIGGALFASADVCIAITGIAGPDGGSNEKPVGLVYIGCYVKGDTVIKKYNFKGNRKKIRDYAVYSALDLVRRCLAQLEN